MMQFVIAVVGQSSYSFGLVEFDHPVGKPTCKDFKRILDRAPTGHRFESCGGRTSRRLIALEA